MVRGGFRVGGRGLSFRAGLRVAGCGLRVEGLGLRVDHVLRRVGRLPLHAHGREPVLERERHHCRHTRSVNLGHADAEARRSVLTALPCATLVTRQEDCTVCPSTHMGGSLSGNVITAIRKGKRLVD